eukprot:CAMPEP_0194450982 /NCGR_PEP_ID=MMETSP0176-20130528/131047_1 /TAXON_ID=216777 /ORGANISM="Proboscia alata, Strain PI-D3" /LENGTH=104 /DNA_ID=CAMNT_0039278365 /DNA_START=284 /DNA_END=598 /DNA_ORIENTATION=-
MERNPKPLKNNDEGERIFHICVPTTPYPRKKSLKLFVFTARAASETRGPNYSRCRILPRANAHWNKKQKQEFREGKKMNKHDDVEEPVLRSTGKKRNASLMFEN